MKIKALTICALLGASLIGGQAFAGGGHYGEKKVKRITTYHVIHKKPSGEWHKHPKNPYTNDTYHNHPNGHNYHVHNYGKGSAGYSYTGYAYELCSYPRYK